MDLEQRMQRAEQQIEQLSRLITGDGSSNLGIAARLEIVWRSYLWLFGVLGVAAGWIINELMR